MAHNEEHAGNGGPHEERVEEDGNDDAVEDDALLAEGGSHFAQVKDAHLTPIEGTAV